MPTNTAKKTNPPDDAGPKEHATDPVKDYQNHVKQVLNQRYTSIAERLKAEPNIINRYELKLSLESILQVYKDLFPEG